jgi:hypothetical protein
MTLETVDLDRCVGMAFRAKIFGILRAHNLTVFTGLRMTVNTSGETVFFCANAF